MMLWMEEKGRVLVDEPSREPSNIMRKLRRHEAATCELAATQGHVEGLQQVRDAGTRVRGLLGFMFPLQEEWISLSRALASPSFLFHSAGNPGLSMQTSPESFSRPFPSSLRGSPLACRLCLDCFESEGAVFPSPLNPHSRFHPASFRALLCADVCGLGS